METKLTLSQVTEALSTANAAPYTPARASGCGPAGTALADHPQTRAGGQTGPPTTARNTPERVINPSPFRDSPVPTWLRTGYTVYSMTRLF